MQNKWEPIMKQKHCTLKREQENQMKNAIK